MCAGVCAGWRTARLELRASLPALFANSFPKSGTHLLTQVLAGFTQLGPFIDSGLPAVTMYNGRTGEAFPMQTLIRRVNRFAPGDIGYGHLHAQPPIVDALCKPGMAAYFILRDPRDVVVSHAYYVTRDTAGHVLKTYYDQLEGYEEQLKVSITGLTEIGFDFPDIAERFSPYVGWLDRPEVLILHFEDFLTQREASLRKVLDHAITRGFAFNGDQDEAVATLSSVIDPTKLSHLPQRQGWRVAGDVYPGA